MPYVEYVTLIKTNIFKMDNDSAQQKMVWTIGHSTRTLEHFIVMLESFNIETLVDIRSFPGSKRYPH